MMRLPRFRYLQPTRVDEAATILSGEGPEAMPVAGGTDLYPNMKRRQQTPGTVVSLREIGALHDVTNGQGLSIGACNTLTDLVRDERVKQLYPALWQAAAQVATPHLRNMATLGGNLCLDTRCTYYDQSYEWRKAIDFCMKKDGQTCWVAPSSKRCLAVSSTDTAPALIALGARVTLHSVRGERKLRLEDLYRNDGIEYLTRERDELLTRVELDPSAGWSSCYWKLRRRGSFDFPVLSVAAAIKRDDSGSVEQARLVLGAVSSQPQVAEEASIGLVGTKLEDDAIEAAAEAAAKLSKPMDNTDFVLHWRKRVTTSFVRYALRELRGEDLSDIRRRIQQHDLSAI